MRDQIRELASDGYVRMDELETELGATQEEIFAVIQEMKREGVLREDSRVYNDDGTIRQMTGWTVTEES